MDSAKRRYALSHLIVKRPGTLKVMNSWMSSIVNIPNNGKKYGTCVSFCHIAEMIETIIPTFKIYLSALK